jgi:hypothetical protein
MITKNRVFSLIVVLSLGLGIAANSTLFSFVYSVLFRPLPLDHANELVFFQWSAQSNWLAVSTSGTTNYDEKTKTMTSTSLSYEISERTLLKSQRDFGIPAGTSSGSTNSRHNLDSGVRSRM